ncbi:Sac2 family-domain-containing protein [Leucosporidium creatinivorum]|uniref:Sac2 family-domain-containing protein n=1 Tax=Leucosporidium creatinivorum TaxID=106004 RepID=A0A1Y2F8J5_9BASI|nr:Sac2 family-domain-containing protein [Leucosporidium creatinivorum]
MASVSELIGLTQGDTHASTSKLQGTSLATDPTVDPDDYPAFASAARDLGTDIRSAYAEALEAKEKEEKVQDRYFLDRAKEFVELNDQVETSASLLTDLSSFLSTFQSDLSAVSGHISELQGRSKTIEGRLEARKAVERSLNPFLDSITISPELIRIIAETEVDDAWIPAVTELDAKLGAIRGGARVEGRRTLDNVAEALRLKATQKILTHLINLLRPFTLSITASLPTLQTDVLLPLKPLFDFLRRHAARQAHDFQKAYTQTTRWYYETGFRRYIRGLEKIRVKGVERSEVIGVVSQGVDGLSQLKKNGAVAPGQTASASTSAIDHSQVSGPGVILGYTINDKNFRPSPEALFRSASLVLADNAQTEYSFVSSFFGQHSTLAVPEARTPSLFSSTTGSWTSESGQGTTVAGGAAGEEGSVKGVAGVAESESGRTSVAGSGATSREAKEEKEEKLKRAVVEGVWKSIMEPAQEYVSNFAGALLDPAAPPSPISLLSMIRLNESLLSTLVTPPASLAAAAPPTDDSDPFPAPTPPPATCPPMENHLIALRMQLYPSFAKSMNSQVESLRKINGTLPAAGVFGGGKASGTNVKDAVVQVIARRYAELFNTVVALSGEGDDEEMVFSSLLRLRQELDKLLAYQASKIPDEGKQRAFLQTHYEELLAGLSEGLSSHTRSQAEVAHFREMGRKAGRE